MQTHSSELGITGHLKKVICLIGAFNNGDPYNR